MKVGFVGLGLMGHGMAKNILAAGHSLMVNTRTPGKAERFASENKCTVGTLEEVGSSCNIIMVCVTDSPDVVAVSGPLIANAKPGTVIVDCSTISPEVTRTVAAQAAERKIQWLDAPISGGTKGANEGTLTIMVGGDAQALAIARPVMECMGKNITHFGASGQGQVAKCTNQIMVACNLLGVCEAFAFAQKNGLDLEQVHAALTGGAANSWALSVLGGRILEDDYAPTFMVKLQTKDLRLVQEAAAQSHVPVPGTSLANQMLTSVEAEGRGEDGTQSLVRTYRKLAAMPETTKSKQ